MKIYVGHSSDIDYKYGLYQPLKESELAKEHEFIFPHDGWGSYNSKSVITGCDVMLAEVSKPSTGLGIEMGWANSYSVPIIALSKWGASVSDSVQQVIYNKVEYSSKEELVEGIQKVLSKL